MKSFLSNNPSQTLAGFNAKNVFLSLALVSFFFSACTQIEPYRIKTFEKNTHTDVWDIKLCEVDDNKIVEQRKKKEKRVNSPAQRIRLSTTHINTIA